MMESDLSNAEIDKKTLSILNNSFNSEVNISSGKGRLDVLAFTGLIGRRCESRIIFPIPVDMINGAIAPVVLPPFDIEFVYPSYPNGVFLDLAKTEMFLNVLLMRLQLMQLK